MAFDILSAKAESSGAGVTSRMALVGPAGADQPPVAGQLADAPVWSYVWPTTLDPATVGFEAGTGILALAATSHPDFDDTLEDDGDPKNDGAPWHSHWVVLTPTPECGEGALAVRDIRQAGPRSFPTHGRVCRSSSTAQAFNPFWTAKPYRSQSPCLMTQRVNGSAMMASLRCCASTPASTRQPPPATRHPLCVENLFDVALNDLSLPGQVD